MTVSGKDCMVWTAGDPHVPKFAAAADMESLGLGDHNYCRFGLVWFFAAGTKATIRSSLRYKFCTLINLTLPLPYMVSTQAGVVFPCMTSPSLASGE